MGRRATGTRRGGRALSPLLLAAAVLGAAALVAAAVVLVVGRSGAGGRPVAGPSPRPTAPPAPAVPPVLAPAAATAPVPGPAALSRALAGVLRDPRLGPGVTLSITDAISGVPVLQRGAAVGAVPASTTKITTAVAALVALPAEKRLVTRVLAGPAPGVVVLVGGGDPTLAGAHPRGGYPAPASLRALAAGVRAARPGAPVRQVLVDDRLYVGPRLGPGWKPGYVTGGDVAPVSALEVDGGRRTTGEHVPRVPDAALEAGRQLARLLAPGGVPVARGAAPPGAAQLAAAPGPTVAQLVELMLSRSDNDIAEALGRQVALAAHLPASFAGETAAVRAVLAGLDPPAAPGSVRLVDASGLSPMDRIAPSALTALLHQVAAGQRFGPVLSGLPVAGFDGTLAARFRAAPAAAAAGAVRAKTGTLDGVSTLAGLVRTRDGRLLAFDLAANRVPLGGTAGAQAALDRVAAAVAGCGCPPGP